LSMPRYAAKRDANESPLITLARALGAEFERTGPLDFWCGFRGRWVPLEIKTDEGTYTPKQVNFMARCEARKLPMWTWRTEADVMRDLGARRTA
jgi:hypothetical protein